MKLVAIVLGFSFVGLLITFLSAWIYDCVISARWRRRSKAFEEERRARNSRRFSRHGSKGNFAGKTSS